MDANILFEQRLHFFRQRGDRVFGWLMLGQSLVVVFVAFSSSTPAPASSSFWTSIGLAAALAIGPLYFAFFNRGHKLGGYIATIAQMVFAAFFIHLMSGRFESHFLVFCSLAFVSIYRNWRLLVLAAAIAILDHLLRGHFAPQSIYGTSVGVERLWLEHSAWIAFMSLYFAYTCRQAIAELSLSANAQSALMNSRLESECLNIRRTQFFSVISHEIRTPLNGIIGFADFLKDSPLPQEQKEYVAIIKQCSDTLLKLINDLLDFSRIDSGCLEIDPHTFKVQDIQHYLENVFSLQCQQKNLYFVYDVSPEVPMDLVGDSHRIRQVLSNLVSNAIKFTDRGGIRVRLQRVHPEKNEFRWSVEDTGAGIKKDYLKKIFSPYTQEFSSTARTHGGSGLGLAISKKLVELMGGELKVASALGQGTAFSFTIPLKPNM